MDSLSTFLAGAVAGIAHVVLAPDHVMALLVFSAEARGRAWRVGAAWGSGHAGAIAGVALLAVGVREQLRWELPDAIGEGLAGALLIAIGALGLAHARGVRPGSGHAHGPEAHTHTGLALLTGAASGLVHALAGHGALFAVVPALGLEPAAARLYLVAFTLTGVGAVVALTVGIGWLTALPLSSASGEGYARVVRICSWLSIAAGVLWAALTALGLDLHAHA